MAAGYVTELQEEPDDPLAHGGSGRIRRFQAKFLGKTNNADFPYTVANELIASSIGWFLGLDVPPQLLHDEDGIQTILIQQIQRSTATQVGPPATAAELEEFIESHADYVHGAILFDLFVGNNDRAFGPMRRNLFLSNDGRLMLIDQGNALYYRPRPHAGIQAGIPRLDALEHSPEALFDMQHKGNIYLQYLDDDTLVDAWCRRIEEMPDHFIDSCVDRIPVQLERPTEKERERLRAFLKKRKSYFRDHVTLVRNRKSV